MPKSNGHHKLFWLVCTPNCALSAAGPSRVVGFLNTCSAVRTTHCTQHLGLGQVLERANTCRQEGVRQFHCYQSWLVTWLPEPPSRVRVKAMREDGWEI